MGYIMGSIMVGEMLGPLLGSALYKNYGYFYQFVVLDLFIIFVLMAVYRYIPEERINSSDVTIFYEFLDDGFNDAEISQKLFSCRAIVLDIMCFCINICMDTCYIGFYP